MNAEFVAAMEDVLELYEEPADPKRPKVCFDETPRQLIAETRQPLPGARVSRSGMTMNTGGTAPATCSCFSSPTSAGGNGGHRPAHEGGFRASDEVAGGERFPERRSIRVILDNLNTHRPAALYEAFAPEEARRILRRLEFHYTPKHGSWLNMAEVELSVFDRLCWDRRIGEQETLVRETSALEHTRNSARATVQLAIHQSGCACQVAPALSIHFTVTVY